jgi:hypothetical protein
LRSPISEYQAEGDRLNHQYLTAIASLIKPKQNPIIALVLNNQRSLLLKDADYDRRSLSMLQKNAVALNQKVGIKFSAIAP